MRKIKIAFLFCWAMLLCLSFAGCAGCKGCSKDPSPSGSDSRVEQKIEDVTITLDKTSLLMTIGDEVRLNPTVTGEGDEIFYVSNNTAIATVDEYGLITAISEGSTVIRASYGEATHSCEVTVGLGGMRPALALVQIADEHTKVAVNDVLNLESRVLFNGKYFNDVKVAYTLSDPSVGTVTEENIFTPLKTGTTLVKMKAKWRGIEDEVMLTKQITIEVQNDVALYVNDGATEYTLYTLDELQGKTYPTTMNFQANVTANGNPITCETTITEGQDKIEFDGTSVTALGYGKAVITIQAEYEGEAYEKDVVINVLRPVGVYADTVEYFSALDGDLPITSIFGKSTTIVDAEQNAKALTVVNNKVLGVETNRDSVSNTKIVVYSADRGYEVSLLAYTKILNDAGDLRSFAATENNPIIDGYFYLANDIVSVEDEHYHTGYWPNVSNTTTNSSCGFKGILEGNGHTISYVFSEVGLLANLLDGAVVRNVALLATRNTENQTRITPCVLAHNSGLNVKVENVYVRVKNNIANSTRNIAFIGTRSASLGLNCVIIENDTAALTKVGGVLFYADAARKNANVQNKLNNVYVISSYPFMGRWETYKCIYANNDTADSTYTTEENTITNYTGVNRYDSYVEMAEKVSVYNAFNQSFWNVSLGVPVWKSFSVDYVENANVLLGETDTTSGTMTLQVGSSVDLRVLIFGKQISYTCEILDGSEYVSYADGKLTANDCGTATVQVSYVVGSDVYERRFTLASTLPTQEYSQTIEFSALDGDLPLNDIFGEDVTIVKAYQGANELTVSDNKVFGLKTERDGLTVTQISVFTEDEGCLINLNAYTKILDDANDFKIFDLTENKIVDGYYYLKNDVTLTEAYSHSAYWSVSGNSVAFSANIGFNGVFEGNGYTVSYPFNEWGLLGSILGDAVIQNVCFNATRNAEESSVATQTGAIARSSYGGEIKNVYLRINDTLSNAKRNASMIGYRYYDKNSYGYTMLTDVIVEALDSDETLRGGVLFDSDAARSLKDKLLDKGVYVISSHECIAKWTTAVTSSMCFAVNDSYTESSEEKVVKYLYVTRYDNVNGMGGFVSAVGNWKIENGIISWAN